MTTFGAPSLGFLRHLDRVGEIMDRNGVQGSGSATEVRGPVRLRHRCTWLRKAPGRLEAAEEV